MLRETAILPVDLRDVDERRVLRASGIRVASAFDAVLPALDTGPVRKVVVALWAERVPPPDESLPGRLTRDDDVLEIGRRIDAAQLASLDAETRARRLLDLHHEALRVLCGRYGWDGGAVDGARAAALREGIVARRRTGPRAHPDGRWTVEAEGHVGDAGLHVVVRVRDASGGAVLEEAGVDLRGNWHDLRGLLHAVAWRGAVAALAPLPRAAAMQGRLPEIDMSVA